MFAELPKLLDRNFAIAFFLPAAAWGLAAWGTIAAFGQGLAVENFLKRDALVGTVLALILVWLLSLLLLALNYQILRLYEGYGDHRLLRWRATRHRERFRLEAAPALATQADIDNARTRGEKPEVPLGHPGRLRRAIDEFPDAVEWILPTRFGNLLRAFEIYPRVIYGLDAIPAWPRLQAVMPEHARKMLADAKAQLDFCINLSLGGWLTALLHSGLALAHWRLPAPWALVLACLVGWVGYRLATSAAAGFGTYVKAAFDLYRGELAKQLGLELPRSAEAEREMWRAVSRMMIYRSAARADDLAKFKPRRTDIK